MADYYIPKSSESFSARGFQKIVQTERDNIASVQFVPPKIGKKGYGSFRVEYRNAVLRKATSWAN